MRYFAIVLAAGTGQRLKNKSNIPKQFIKIKDRSILLRSLSKFLENKNIEKIILSVNRDYEDEYERELFDLEESDRDKIIMVNGGNSRAESLHSAMLFLRENLMKFDCNSSYNTNTENLDEIAVVTHDVARPFVNIEVINEHIKRLENENILATAVPTIDTIFYTNKNVDTKFLDGEYGGIAISKVINRDFCVNAQTPQSITLKKYFTICDERKNAFLSNCSNTDSTDSINSNIEMASSGENISGTGGLSFNFFDGVTDLISLVDLSKHKVGIVLGDNRNIKITTNVDLEIAKLLVSY